MITTSQKVDVLWKLYYASRGDSDTQKKYNEEPYSNKLIIGENNLLLGAVPTTAPGGPPISGVPGTYGNVELIQGLLLSPASNGAPAAYYHPSLVNAIQFNYGDGSYLYYLTTGTGVPIQWGQNNWFVDPGSGILIFFNDNPPGVSLLNPPKISFYRYVGPIGVIGAGANAIQIQGVDVSATPPTNDQILVYDNIALKWIPKSLIGDSKRIEIPLVTSNITVNSTSYTVLGRYQWIQANNSGFGTIRVVVNTLITDRTLTFKAFNQTTLTDISPIVTASSTGITTTTITNPTADALIEIQAFRQNIAGTNPIVRACIVECQF